MDEGNEKLLDLLKRFYYAASKLDGAYCTVINNEDFTQGLTADEYEKCMDVFIEVKELLMFSGTE